MKPPILAAATLFAAVIWTVALIAESGALRPVQVTAVGVGLLTSSAVGLVGMVLVGGRWARRLSLLSVAATVPLAVVRPIDPLWAVALTASAIGGVSLFHPRVTARVRKLPAAAGPPSSAVVLAVGLLGAPYLIGMAAIRSAGWAVLVVALTAPAAAFAYSRVVPGGLWAVRVVWPALAVSLAPPLGLPAGAVSVALGLSAAALAWHPSVKTAYHPPREAGSTFPIPPELTPRQILDAADVDERGRRKQ